MENEVDPEIIKATQNLLGKYVKRPPLNEKLLKKPPFRFLHDIVTTVLKTTGFFDGLFEQEELISENVKDRESKIVFLTKVIQVVGSTTGKSLTVKPSKVVAGQEADKTNLLLQTLAEALDQNLSSKDAVQKYKESSKVSEKSAKTKTDKSDAIKKESTNKSNDAKKQNEKLNKKGTEKSITKTNKTTVSKTKEKETVMKDSVSKKTPQTKLKEKVKSIDKPSENLSNEVEKSITSAKNNLQQPVVDNRNTNGDMSLNKKSANDSSPISEKDKEEKNESLTMMEENTLNSSFTSDLIQVENESNNVKKSLKKEDVSTDLETKHNVEDYNQSEHVSTGNNITNDELKKPNSGIQGSNGKVESEVRDSTQKVSSRKSTPLKEKSEESLVRPASVRPSSSRPGAPRPREKFETMLTDSESILVGKVNIITESSPNEEEEDSSIVIVDDPIVLTQNQNKSESIPITSNGHGHLVQQILDSQRELSQATGKTEIEWQFGAQKARETINQEVEQIRYNIQALSRAANPLGKLLDHLQEDVEIMRQELQQWTATYDKSAKEVLKQKAINEESLLPLHTKLKQLEADTQDKHSKINDLKVIVQKNSSRIDKLLAVGSVQ